jgi:putative sigma-54 modulation protein
MKYQIIGKNIEVTDAIRSDIQKKLHRMDKYFIITDEVLCRAVVSAYKVGAKVEITIFTKEMDFRTEVRNNDLYAAVDLAIDKLEDQMRRLKTRMEKAITPRTVWASLSPLKTSRKSRKMRRMKSFAPSQSILNR